MDLPLKDIVVLDLTQYLAGPFGTQILGDLGAEVIKVEPPSGDISREVSPRIADGTSTYYLSINRNKKSIAIDLKSPAGLQIVEDLMRKADVVIENFRPGVADRLGVGWQRAQQINPRLVFCSVSGFGQDGPSRDLPAFDIIAQAVSGVMSVNGHPGAPSARVGVPIGDVVAGMYATIGVLAGLQQRARTGVGSQFDVAMLDSQVSLLTYLASAYLETARVPGLQGRGHQAVPTYRSFSCRDGVEIVVAANTAAMWPVLCGALEVESMLTDPRFDSPDSRLKNRAVLEPMLEEAFQRFDSDVMLERLKGRIPSSRINNVAQALEDPQVVFRSMITELVDQDGSSVRVVGNPVKVVGHETPTSYPPHLGEHRSYVLKDVLGYDEEQVHAVAAAGAFGKRELV